MSLGPEPSKPVIKPPKPMKALHWKRIVVEKDQIKDSIWHLADSSHPNKLKINPSEVFDLFGSKPAKQLGGAAAGAGQSCFLPRFLNISIS